LVLFFEHKRKIGTSNCTWKIILYLLLYVHINQQRKDRDEIHANSERNEHLWIFRAKSRILDFEPHRIFSLALI